MVILSPLSRWSTATREEALTQDHHGSTHHRLGLGAVAAPSADASTIARARSNASIASRACPESLETLRRGLALNGAHQSGEAVSMSARSQKANKPQPAMRARSSDSQGVRIAKPRLLGGVKSLAG